MDNRDINQGSGCNAGGSEATIIAQSLVTPLPLKSAIPSTSGSQNQTGSSPAPEISKILSRNSNGTLVLTSSPNNEAELQLYRVMQRASLLAYYDTLLEMGGDDVQQLCDAGEEEFLEIMALVGMASKPLHVRRLQKALQEWVSNPSLFLTPLTPNVPPNPNNFTQVRPTTVPLPVPTAPVVTISSVVTNNSHVSPIAIKEVPPAPRSPGHNQVVHFDVNNQRESTTRGASPVPCSGGQSPGSPLQLTPVLVESQISRLADAAEALVKSLPQFEPKPHSTKKKICRDLENVMNMAEDDPRRMDEIRKYAAIYGRFDCKRKPEKPLTLHEVSVNEAAAQICRFAPALLTRRDELFPLARQLVKDSGYHYSKGHTSVTPLYRTHSYQLSSKNGDENHTSKRPKVDSSLALSPSPCDINDMDRMRRQERLEQIAEELRILTDRSEELEQSSQQVRQSATLQTLQQQIEAVQNKRTQLLLERNDLLKQPLPMRSYRRNSNRMSISNFNDSERHDTDDTDSQFSLSNASSPSQEVGDSRDSLLRDGENFNNNSNGPSSVKSPGKLFKQFVTDVSSDEIVRNHIENDYDSFYKENKVQVISSSGGNIIAVANPELSMSSVILPNDEPDTESTLGIKIKIEPQSPELISEPD